MNNACEELRTGAGDGGKLFRIAMTKTGVFRDGFPIEYGKLQTEGPSREGWNHEWTR
jgi:large subunit ribosomal protein L40